MVIVSNIIVVYFSAISFSVLEFNSSRFALR
nr:MAG TPA: hypothetical protein [Bacteriophage sp.]